MPISSYPRFTLSQSSATNNPASGIGLSILNTLNNEYKIADSNLFPINNGGIAANETLQATDFSGQTVGNSNQVIVNNTQKQIGPTIYSISDLLVDVNDNTAANLLFDIKDTLSIIQANLANGTYAVQIKGSNGNLANVSASNRINVVL